MNTINCHFCYHETPLKKCYRCIYCARILCEDCCYGDEVTPEGVKEYGCEK